LTNLSDWNPYYPSDQVITFETYLATEHGESEQRVRVINLCRSYSYLSDGYYCSLLAEARGITLSRPLKCLTTWVKKSPLPITAGRPITGFGAPFKKPR